jgi:hypothetical protein
LIIENTCFNAIVRLYPPSYPSSRTWLSRSDADYCRNLGAAPSLLLSLTDQNRQPAQDVALQPDPGSCRPPYRHYGQIVTSRQPAEGIILFGPGTPGRGFETPWGGAFSISRINFGKFSGRLLATC